MPASRKLTTLPLIDLAKSVAKVERDEVNCGFYAVLSPREGQHFSQSTRLEMIMNHDQTYREKHEASRTYKEFQEYQAIRNNLTLSNLTRNSAIEKEELLDKPPSNMSFTPKAGFAQRKEASKIPVKKFLWIAKLDSHPGKFEEFLEAIKIHASNVERTEDEALSFLVLQSHDTENSVTLFERYTSEEYFKNVHSTSESMHEYRKKVCHMREP
jgi:quinol monooxygenase YgiN